MSIKKIEHKSCKGNHKDSKKIVDLSRSISIKGRSETRGESERDKEGTPKRRKPGDKPNNETNTHTTCVRDKTKHSHYMCQRPNEAHKRTANQATLHVSETR
jgi:hypothetical protein